jgi:hypothetical protein
VIFEVELAGTGGLDKLDHRGLDHRVRYSTIGAIISSASRLTLTEQGVYFDDLENPEQRIEGMREALEMIAPIVE